MDNPIDLSLTRCEWNLNDELLTRYHDEEWGTPVHDDQVLFEFISLDGMQAGLSWNTILRKRPAFRRAFDNFHIPTVAAYGEDKVAELLNDASIVRNRSKINAIINNAARVMEVQREFGSLDFYLWSFVDGKTIQNHWETLSDIPPKSKLSDRISKDLIARGFKFCGSTIIYAILQSAGLVNDHIVTCFRHVQIERGG
jgi:DNA-3-methyladenine glycosylase I